MPSQTRHLSRDRDYLDVFQQVTKAVSSATSLDEIINLVLTKMTETLVVSGATMFLLDEDSSQLTLRASCGLSERYLNKGQLESENSIADVLRGDPAAIYDVASDPRIKYKVESQKEGIKSLLAVPIFVYGKALGALKLLTREFREFTPDEIKFAVSLAEHCGIAIQHFQDMEARDRQVHYLEALHEVSQMVNTTLDVKTILDRIVLKLPRMMGLQAATVRLLDETGKHLVLVASRGLSEKYLSRGSIDSEEAIQLVLEGKPVAMAHVTTDPRIKFTKEAKEEGIESILAVPITAMGEILGVLRLLSTSVRDFSEEEINFVTALSEQSGIAIRNAMHYEQVNNLLYAIEGERRFLQQVVDTLDVQLMAVDLNKNIVLVNTKFEEAHHLTKESLLGKKCERLENPDCAESCDYCMSCPLEQVIKTKHAVNFATRRESIDGISSFLDVILAPILDQEGEVENVIEIVRDITVQWLQEQQTLETEKMKGVLETSAAVSHELNSPIFAALGTAQLMKRSFDDKERLIEDIELIIRNLKKITDLTAKIGRISKYQTRDYVGDERLLDIHGLEGE
ncbi:MAG: GAF domain-containing protein [Desulfomonilaceae bacterium]|jgi:PAS domain S-box-containing protein